MHSGKDLLGIVAGILEGETQRMAGDFDAAIKSFRRAADRRTGCNTTNRSPAIRRAHWLGAALLESQRFEDAEKVYLEDLKEHPRNGWSLLGLEQGLEGQGTSGEQVSAELAASWARADTWIRASRF